jgi:hypothetical protein
MANTYEPISTTTLSTATASVTFSSISATYTDLVIIAQFGQSTGGNAVGMQFNSDTANNYSITSLYGTGTTAASDRLANTSHIWGAYNIAPSSVVSGVAKWNIQNYSNTTTYKTALCRYDNNDATYAGTSAVVGLWRSTAAITSITLKPSAGNLASGSTFTLYGIKAA